MSTPSVRRPRSWTRARLAERVVAHERDRVGVGRVVLDVARRDDLERDPRAARGSPAAAARSRRGRAARHDGFAATQISSTATCATTRPENAVVVRVVDRVVGRVELDEVDDVEPGAAQEPEELAVRELPLDADLARPLHPTEAALRPLERLAGRRLLVGRAEDRERVLRRNQSRPPGRRGGGPRGASGAGRTRCSRRTRRRRGRSSPTAAGTSSALASTSGNTMPVSSWQRRAVASCAGVTSTPTGARRAGRARRRRRPCRSRARRRRGRRRHRACRAPPRARPTRPR